MATLVLSSEEEIAQQGAALYQGSIRQNVETPENLGKLIAIDINTGDYEIDSDLLVAHDRLQSKHPGSIPWTERIGYDAVYAVGGTVIRTV
jgi:hypothetical protein